MLYAGLDLSRNRVDVCVLDENGRTVEQLLWPADRDGLVRLAERFGRHQVRAAVESMNGARFVHDQLELQGWEVDLADAVKVKGLAPLACKTDKVDARVLAELCRLDLVPAIWLPSPAVREERERARWRLHLVKHRVSLKRRIHSTLITFGHPCPVADLFGEDGRQLLAALDIPEPWRANVQAALALIDDLDRQIDDCEMDLRRLGAEHQYIPLLLTIPGISWVLAYTIASELGEIERFAGPKQLVAYSGLCPRVIQSGRKDIRGPLAKNGPAYLRWALVEAAIHACRHPAYDAAYQRTKTRLGKQRGAKVARVEVARKLASAIWWMLTRNQAFNPAGPTATLVA